MHLRREYSFALLKAPILTPFIITGFTTFTLSFIGAYVGKELGHLFGQEIKMLGGVVLNWNGNIHFNQLKIIMKYFIYILNYFKLL